MPDATPTVEELIAAITTMRVDVDQLIADVVEQVAREPRLAPVSRAGRGRPDGDRTSPSGQPFTDFRERPRIQPPARTSGCPVPTETGSGPEPEAQTDTDQRLDALAKRLEGHLRQSNQRKSRTLDHRGEPERAADTTSQADRS